MSANANARIARESLEAAFASDWKRLRETYADDATMVGGGLDIRGADDMVALWQGCHEEERGLRLEILNVVADEEMAVVEFRHKGVVKPASPRECPKRWLANAWRRPRCTCSGFKTGRSPP